MFDLEPTGQIKGMVIRCHKCGYDNKIKKIKIKEAICPKEEKLIPVPK